jgi:hypothetical protein
MPFLHKKLRHRPEAAEGEGVVVPSVFRDTWDSTDTGEICVSVLLEFAAQRLTIGPRVAVLL